MVEYDHLDEPREEAMYKAERKCRKLHMGAIPWSPTLQLARVKVQYIKLTLCRKQGRKVSARYLMCLSKKAGINYENISNRKLEKLLYKALQEYKAIKKEYKQLRKSFHSMLDKMYSKELRVSFKIVSFGITYTTDFIY